jgi:TonB family protein
VPATTVEIRFRPLHRGTFVGGVLATLAIHLGLVGLVYYAHVKSPARTEEVHDVLITRTISLGKPREKFWLPRLVQPPKPKAPPPTIKLSDDLAAPAAKKEAPRPPDADISKELKRAHDRARALARNLAEEPPEGSLTGSEHGTANEASAGDAYATAVYEAIKKNWNVPAGLSVGDVINLDTEVRISISDDGTILAPRMTKSSGNGLYDDSCVQAVAATRKVPPPPASVRARYRRGVVLEFGGKDLAR